MTSIYTVERARTIEAPVARVFPLVADLTQWTRWSPWEDLDPDLQRAYSGADEGVGQVYAWSGNRKAGAGRMEIVRAEEDRLVEVDVRFEKPFTSQSTSTFTFASEGDRTLVIWTMTGPRPALMRLTQKFFDMDRLMGKDFEKGLARMALVAPPPDPDKS